MPMPALLELQRDFARGLLAADDPGATPWILGDAVTAADRAAVHRNTFVGVIVAAMRITYPVVERLVGAEFFEAAAQLFLQDHPPRSAYLNAYGAEFAAFLAAFPPAAALGYLPDVARLEWAVAGAATAEDAPPLDPAALASLPPEELEALRLVPHPSLRLVALATPADAIWRAIASGQEDALGTIAIAGDPFTVVVHRSPNGVMLRRLTATELAATAALSLGSPIGTALAGAPEAEAMTLLADHLASGRFTRAEAPDLPQEA